ncbi:anti-sigma factor [Micromonospora sp. RTGN7]|uniref:anti-sigma factor n=1 Tax=Micromonospora sp. RTGN7 TaxID=3016526 RepID=UPI0029FF4608|nr:anti-sigma factor [Micromonospora sp. RTGN7]
MPHLEHDRLVFLALGESEADSGEARHLGACAHCRNEVTGLRHVAGLGAGTRGLNDLPDPPAHVWQGILAEITTAGSLPSGDDRHTAAEITTADSLPSGDDRHTAPMPRAAGTTGTRPATHGARATGDGATGAARPATGGGTATGGSRVRRGRRRLPRWAGTVATAVAAAAIGVVGTLAVLSNTADDPRPPERVVLAGGQLSAYGTTSRDANGDARVFTDGQLHLHVANLPKIPGYYEVWLIDPKTMRMFSVGVLNSGTGDALLPLPPNVDVRTYSVVDVSAERYDNKPAHSGDSLLRGALTG